jgi:anti-sigma regulatory factor (Ser/Thr protein kinase)
VILLKVSDSTHASEARRAALKIANQLGFNDVAQGNLAIVVTEAATNLLKHGGGGKIILRSLENGDRRGVEMLASDSGVGIANISECLRDGYSTAGSSGTGLGAISRLSSSWAIFSVPNQGTIVQSASWTGGPVSIPAGSIDVAALWTPFAGEEACGDVCAYRSTDSAIIAMIADGLGHGVLAAEAANKAADVFHSAKTLNAASMLESMHGALRDTRGAAIGIAEIDTRKSIVRFAGVGNIAGAIVDDSGSRHLVSLNGIVGHQAKAFREFESKWNPGATLILHSDGLRTRWDLAKYPGLRAKPSSMLAAALLRDESRGTDDASVLVAKLT